MWLQLLKESCHMQNKCFTPNETDEATVTNNPDNAKRA